MFISLVSQALFHHSDHLKIGYAQSLQSYITCCSHWAGYGQDMSVWQCPLALQQAIISLSTYFMIILADAVDVQAVRQMAV